MKLKTALVLVISVALSLGVSTACTKKKAEEPVQNTHDGTNISPKEFERLSSMELKIEEIAVGKGAEAQNGKTVSVHYTGTLESGTKFDSSLDRGEPISFELGSGRVIQGWEKGILGMKVGGKRKLTIPPKMGYGERPMGPIPPYSVLFFDVELVAVK